MKYMCSTRINLPRARVIELFDSAENMFKWQEGLQSFTHISGEAGKVGAKSEIVYQMGKRKIEMVETIVESSFPDLFSATYETTGVWNIVENRFFVEGIQETRWDIETEFKCSGFLKVLAAILPGMFRKQTKKMMADFKAFAESA